MAFTTSINTPYTVLTGVVLLAIVFAFAVIKPQIDSINTLRHDIIDNTNSLTAKQEFLASLDAKSKQLQNQPDIERQLAVVIPETDMTQDVLRVIDQYATQAGVSTTSITNSSAERQAKQDASIARGEKSATPNTVRTLSFKTQVSGSYLQVREFLKFLEKSPRIIDIVGLGFKQASGQSGQITAEVTIQTYAQASNRSVVSQ
jgi:Tfp pilus assembly protein PilO